jgi:Domain of unknown function (DUF2017)
MMTDMFAPSRTPGGSVMVDLRVVRWWLTLYARDLLELLGPAPEQPEDPLAALAASAASSPEPPTDPALARLLPDGVTGDDQAAMEFRRFTHDSLLTRKRSDAERLLELLDGREHDVDAESAHRLLATLNDLRLMLGSRMQVADGDEFEGDDFGDLAIYTSYMRLAWLQEELLATLALPSARDRSANP